MVALSMSSAAETATNTLLPTAVHVLPSIPLALRQPRSIADRVGPGTTPRQWRPGPTRSYKRITRAKSAIRDRTVVRTNETATPVNV